MFGHRGLGGGPRENTLVAFESAVGEGADGVELDVRVCRSGEVVAIHDPSLARITLDADRREVADCTWAELSRVELDGGARIARLDDVLDFAESRSIAVNVELKRDAPSRADVVLATARLLRRRKPLYPLVVSSFDPAMLGLFAAVGPACTRALLVGTGPVALALETAAPLLPVSLLHLERSLATPAAIARHRARGLGVQIWTVNDEAEGVLHAGAGALGIITDRPGAILRMLARRGR